MASAELKLVGLDELREALRQLPEALAAEAAEVIEEAAELTKSSVFQIYPIGDTGNLRAGVVVEHQTSRFGTISKVRSKSPHAHLYEFGTQDRKTRKGWRRGKAKAHEGLVGIAERNRTRMNQKLVEIVRRAGFDVDGNGV